MKIIRLAPYKIRVPEGLDKKISRDWLGGISKQTSFSKEWIRTQVCRNPPVVCEREDTFLVIGGLRSYLWMATVFPEEKIHVVVESAEIKDPLSELIKSELTAGFLTASGKPINSGEDIKRLWLLLDPDQWKSVSTELTSKSGFARLSGLNRRTISQKETMELRSEFRRFSQ